MSYFKLLSPSNWHTQGSLEKLDIPSTEQTDRLQSIFNYKLCYYRVENINQL